MASGEAEPLQYTTTVLRVSIHCEGCKKKVKKVLHNIEGVYKVTIDAAQHKVTVTSSVAAEALVRRLHKAGKQAALWPAPAPASEAAKPVNKVKCDEVVATAPPAAAEGSSKESAGKPDAKPKEPAKENGSDKAKADSSEKKPVKAEAAEQQEEGKVDIQAAEPKEKGSPELPAKEADEAGGEEASGKKGKKKKNKQQKDGGEIETAVNKPLQPASMPAPFLGPERPHGGGFPYYVPPQPVMSYNVAHPRPSVSYYAPMPAVPMQPMPYPPPPPSPQLVPYGYPPYPGAMPPPSEFMYGPPGMRSSPPQESYHNMFNEESANSCSVM